MEGEEVTDPLELCKNPKVIKDAQEEIGQLDVLVCGQCHEVFQYIEPFQEHKQKGKCPGMSALRENYRYEPKAPVWGFLLWKNAQLKAKEVEASPSSWKVYQKWCKLSPEEKEAWVVAGQTILSFTRINSAKIQEIKARTQPTPLARNKLGKPLAGLQDQSKDEEDLEEGEIRLSQLTSAQRVAIKAQVATNKANTSLDSLTDIKDSEADTDDEVEKVKKVADMPKAAPLKPVQFSSNVKKPPELRRALRTNKEDITEEMIVEKILSRRFNHKRRYMEYLIKWENLNDTENTWEPKHHLEKCRPVLEEFDRAFNKPKVPKLKKVVDNNTFDNNEVEETLGRPQRTSKQKALNQVKAWCGDISEGDEGSGKRKSFSDDDDSSDSFEKKIKLEEESESSEDEKPPVTIRRIVKASSSLNGVSKKSEGIITSTPQRVVRVSQKQLPSLSSGVYIMSKTEGIIKLDSSAPPITSSTMLKVGQKIGQTHIKMIRKDTSGPSPGIARGPTKTVTKLFKSTSDLKTPTSISKTLTKPPTISRRIIGPSSSTKTVSRFSDLNDSKRVTDDDSDGLEEMDFPTDLPLPEPDSPPGEFTLCPLTGRILGEKDEPEEQEEINSGATTLDNLVKEAVAELPDIDTCISEQKSDEAAKAPEEAATLDETPAENVLPVETPPEAVDSSTSAIVVNATDAALDNTSENSSNSVVAVTTTTSPPTTTSISSTLSTTVTSKPSRSSKPAIITPSNPNISDSKIIPMKEDMEECITSSTIKRSNFAATSVTKSKPVPQPASSILSTALTTSKVGASPTQASPQKKLLSTPNIQRKTPLSRPSLAKPFPAATIIQKMQPNKSRPAFPRVISQQEPILKRSSTVTTYKPANLARKIGSTTIYKTTEKPQAAQVSALKKPMSTAIPEGTLVSTSQQPTIIQAIAEPTLVQTAVINMPLLTTDEEQPADTAESTTPLNEIEPLPTLPADSGLADLPNFSLPESDTPLLITGDDGTIYQVAGQNEEGQTILISEGPDGQQQCVLVSSDPVTEEASTTLMIDASSAEPDELEQALMINTQQPEETESEGGEESHVVAQIIKADPPSPGGTRKVVLMLPDGNLMMTDVSAEQYAALDLDK